ncbi:ABC transporter ATP-binding protein [Ahniella affigens]|uniref:ABC transporter ATP-binding protein n=1 Tax=Ahniella affigens TaxID=2021234 RepID=A0A2P1PYV9_9GAMM|nr:ABC transporter ATP-binding protein [Ahniella affigens]
MQLNQVGFRYGRSGPGIRQISWQQGAGVLGLLGPNGAGKSTLMRLLATLVVPQEGQILWNGHDVAKKPDALRHELGYLPQDFGVYAALNAWEFLEFLAAVKGLHGAKAKARIEFCLQAVGLIERAGDRLGDYSGGMRQRVGIAQALLNDPSLLIVDEPTVGLDPDERMRFRHLLTELAADRLIILSTHIVSDVEATATELAVMAAGSLQFFGTPEQMLAGAEGHVFEWTIASTELGLWREKCQVSAAVRRPEGIRLKVVADAAPTAAAQVVTPTLEDAYTWLLSKSRKGA